MNLPVRSFQCLNRSLLYCKYPTKRWLCSEADDKTNKNKNGETNNTNNGSNVYESFGFTDSYYNAPKYFINEHRSPCIYDGEPLTFKEAMTDLYNSISKPEEPSIPNVFDVVILGSGPVPCTLANIIKTRFGMSSEVLVIDNDLNLENKFDKTQPENIIVPQLSVGHISQQFSLKENLGLAQYAVSYIKQLNDDARDILDIENSIKFRPFGHLTLATEKAKVRLKENNIIQAKFGSRTELVTPYQISQCFPWLNVKDIVLGSIGKMDEGWFDPHEYLSTTRMLSQHRGAHYLEGIPMEFHFHDDIRLNEGSEQFHRLGYEMGAYQPPCAIVVKQKNGKMKFIRFEYCVILLGSETSEFGKEFFNIKKGHKGLYGLEIPIRRRKHYVFFFESAKPGPGLCSPLIVDPTGVYVRREGFENNYICGCTLPFEDPDADNLNVDENIFLKHLWPILANRIPNFDEIRLKSGWAYFEDHNYLDESPIVGFHQCFHNIYFACGLGKNSYMMAPGIARAISEELYDHYFRTVDLTRFNFSRVAQEYPLLENVIN